MLIRRLLSLWPRLSRILVVLLFVVGVLLANAASASVPMRQSRPIASDTVPGSVVLQPAVQADAPGAVIRVGLHVRNLYNLSLVDQTFEAEGWYWLDWGDDVDEILKRNAIQLDQIVEFSNQIELWDSVQEPSSAWQSIVKPGRHGQGIRFSAKFYVRDVPQRYAPFDPQSLTIDLEIRPQVLTRDPDLVRLEPAHRAADIVGEDMTLSGFDLHGVSWQRSNVFYPDSFLPRMQFSRVSAHFVYDKSDWAMFMKWIFPVLIVMAIVVVSPSIEGVLGDIRIAIPPSALLTLVVMQDGYKNSFPPTPYLTYLDELYVYSYIVCLAIFLLFLVGTNRASLAADGEREQVTRRINRVDSLVQASLVVGFVLVAVAGWFT